MSVWVEAAAAVAEAALVEARVVVVEAAAEARTASQQAAIWLVVLG